ncbi:unnamed protein product [Auanema sp. JU1783]|nr:unnamed protein product [Auanema sp. JU1783]
MPVNENDFNDPEKYINDESIELAWAIKAAERANIHINLLMGCDTKSLKLNRHQPDIDKAFREAFPDMNVRMVGETELKSGDMKEKWRVFCELFKESIDDYSMGTLMRIEAQKAYSDANTIIVPKIIFLAVEGARNTEGINEDLKQCYTLDHQLNTAPL